MPSGSPRRSSISPRPRRSSRWRGGSTMRGSRAGPPIAYATLPGVSASAMHHLDRCAAAAVLGRGALRLRPRARARAAGAGGSRSASPPGSGSSPNTPWPIGCSRRCSIFCSSATSGAICGPFSAPWRSPSLIYSPNFVVERGARLRELSPHARQRRIPAARSSIPAHLFEFLGAQFGVFGPMLFARAHRRSSCWRGASFADRRAAFLAIFALPTPRHDAGGEHSCRAPSPTGRRRPMSRRRCWWSPGSSRTAGARSSSPRWRSMSPRRSSLLGSTTWRAPSALRRAGEIRPAAPAARLGARSASAVSGMLREHPGAILLAGRPRGHGGAPLLRASRIPLNALKWNGEDDLPHDQFDLDAKPRSYVGDDYAAGERQHRYRAASSRVSPRPSRSAISSFRWAAASSAAMSCAVSPASRAIADRAAVTRRRAESAPLRAAPQVAMPARKAPASTSLEIMLRRARGGSPSPAAPPRHRAGSRGAPHKASAAASATIVMAWPEGNDQ